MCFVYFDDMTLKYLTLSSFFRFEICFVLETFFGPTLEAVVLKSSGFLLAFCLDLNRLSGVL